MFIDSNNKTYYPRADLEEVLNRFYNKTTLKGIYVVHFLAGLGRAMPQGKEPPKAKVAAEIVSALEDPKALRRFVDHFDQKQRAVYEYLLWEGRTELSTLEAALGFSVSIHLDPERLRYFDPVLTVRPEFPLLAVGSRELDYYYGRRGSKFDVSLPPAVAALLRKAFPKPAHYEYIETTEPSVQDGLAGSAWACTECAFRDLSLFHDYLTRGEVPRLKGGGIAKIVFRKMLAVTSGREFFTGDTVDGELKDVRGRLLLEIAELLSPEEARPLATGSADPQAFYRSLPKTLKASRTELFACLLPHFRMPPYADTESREQGAAFESLLRLFARLSPGKWVTVRNVLDFIRYRAIDIDYFPKNGLELKVDIESPGYGEYRYNESSVFVYRPEALLDGAIVRTMAMLLAALGCLEVVCPPPGPQSEWRLKKKAWLTPFDGIVAFRLTQAGAYAFGLTEELGISAEPVRAAELSLQPDRLHAVAAQLDPVTEDALNDFMERVGTGLYSMTRETFLRKCDTAEDLARRVTAFRERIAVAELPANWEAFLSGIEQEASPLQQEQGFRIFSVCDVPAVRHAFLTDSVLTANTLKMEGGKIAVHRDNLDKVKRRLRQLGYFFNPR